MARPKTVTRQQILEAARKIFLEKGFRASTADIARAAGVSEGSVFNRFGSKRELFEAAMGIPEFDPQARLAHLQQATTLREVLEGLLLAFVDHLRIVLPRVMMHLTHPDDAPRPIHSLADKRAKMTLILKNVTDLLDERRRRGELRAESSAVVARMLLGSAHNFVFFEINGVPAGPTDAHDFARAVVDVLLAGLEGQTDAPQS